MAFTTTTPYALDSYLKDNEGDRLQRTLCSLCGARMPEIISEALANDNLDISENSSGLTSAGKPKCRTHSMVTRSMAAQGSQSSQSSQSQQFSKSTQ